MPLVIRNLRQAGLLLLWSTLVAVPASARTVLDPGPLGRFKGDDPRLELQGEYGKPWLDPSVEVEDAMKDVLPTRPAFNKVQWEAGKLPENCGEIFRSDSSKAEMKYSVYNVTYDDCDVPWAFCRHDNAGISIDDMAQIFGRLPVRMRELVRSVIGLPPQLPNDGVVAWSSSGDIAVRPCCWKLRILAHEASHILDASYYDSITRKKQQSANLRRPWFVSSPSAAAMFSGHGATAKAPHYSSTTHWRDAEKSDEAVATWYSRVSWAEHFAEMAGQGLLEAMRPGAYRNLSEQASGKLRHQIEAWLGDWADVVADPGTCDSRLRPSMPKSVSGSES